MPEHYAATPQNHKTISTTQHQHLHSSTFEDFSQRRGAIGGISVTAAGEKGFAYAGTQRHNTIIPYKPQTISTIRPQPAKKDSPMPDLEHGTWKSIVLTERSVKNRLSPSVVQCFYEQRRCIPRRKSAVVRGNGLGKSVSVPAPGIERSPRSMSHHWDADCER